MVAKRIAYLVKIQTWTNIWINLANFSGVNHQLNVLLNSFVWLKFIPINYSSNWSTCCRYYSTIMICLLYWGWYFFSPLQQYLYYLRYCKYEIHNKLFSENVCVNNVKLKIVSKIILICLLNLIKFYLELLYNWKKNICRCICIKNIISVYIKALFIFKVIIRITKYRNIQNINFFLKKNLLQQIFAIAVNSH